MTLIEWRDDFRVGDDAVDFEHEEMIRLINEAHARIQQNATVQEIEDFLGEVPRADFGPFRVGRGHHAPARL